MLKHASKERLAQGPLDEASLRFQRAQAAVHALMAAAGAVHAHEALQTLDKVLQNALSSQEDKFRCAVTSRCSNCSHACSASSAS